MTTSLVWFRNDLRLHDQLALTRGIDVGQQTACIYVVDPRHYGTTRFGFERIGKYRRRFLRESLIDLRDNLAAIGGKLRVVVGYPEDLLPKMMQDIDASSLHCTHEYGSEEKALEKKVRQRVQNNGSQFSAQSANTMMDVDDLPFSISELPEVFTKFRNKVEKKSDVQIPIDAPSGMQDIATEHSQKIDDIAIEQIEYLQSDAEFDQRGVLKFKGGENEGLQRVRDYLWDGDHLRRYKHTRNGMLGPDYSSKFSAWLANGSLSPRLIHAEVRQYEDERVANKDTYWMIFELLWRDYFAFIAAKHGRKLFQVGGLRQETYPWKRDWERFDAWREGRTGYPLIDANMIELEQTGFMSNRGRQNVASFLTKNLGIDWRMGAEWFESLLVDYDPSSNYGNWNYSAGVGNDARGFRWFNTTKQSKDYDAGGDYVRHWLPQLQNVPTSLVHEPWKMSRDQQRDSQCVIGVDYPEPIVDLFKSATHHEDLYQSARNLRQ